MSPVHDADFLTRPDENIGDTVIATAIAFIILDVLFVALRVWARRIKGTKISIDDVLVITGLLLCLGNCIIAICAVKFGGVGRHIQYMTTAQKIYRTKIMFLGNVCVYVSSAVVPKLAIIALYLNIFFEDRISRICCYMVAFVLVMIPLVCIPVAFKQCTPLAYLWNKRIHGTCMDQALMFRYASLPNIATDVVMLILPLPVVWKLNQPLRVRIAILVTFATGSIGLVTSIIRFVMFFESMADGTWADVNFLKWTISEVSVYLWASCFLVYKPLLKRVADLTGFVRFASRSSEIPKIINSGEGIQGPTKRRDAYASLFESVADNSKAEAVSSSHS